MNNTFERVFGRSDWAMMFIHGTSKVKPTHGYDLMSDLAGRSRSLWKSNTEVRSQVVTWTAWEQEYRIQCLSRLRIANSRHGSPAHEW